MKPPSTSAAHSSKQMADSATVASSLRGSFDSDAVFMLATSGLHSVGRRYGGGMSGEVVRDNWNTVTRTNGLSDDGAIWFAVKFYSTAQGYPAN
jgi:hypothetical protein